MTAEVTNEVRLATRERPSDQRVVMRQRWTDLLFLHWEVSPAEIQKTLPDGLRVDTFDGRAYVGVVPFLMEKVRPVWAPVLPWISRFPEMNVRTYVIGPDGRPGVWFYSLDASRWPAVMLGRGFFKLPYVWSEMSYQREAGSVNYSCRRRDTGCESTMRYFGIGERGIAEIGSLDFFLVERYLLFAHDPGDGSISCGQVHHAPYEFSPAEVDRDDTTALKWNGIRPAGPCMSRLYSPGVDVEIYPLVKL